MADAPFTPPSAAERAAALGPLDSLPAHLRNFFHLASFSPMVAPAPNDWLACHNEKGQTYEQFRDSTTINRPDAARHVLYLLPLGQFPPHSSPSLELLREYLGIFYTLEARLLPVMDISANKRREEGAADGKGGKGVDSAPPKGAAAAGGAAASPAPALALALAPEHMFITERRNPYTHNKQLYTKDIMRMLLHVLPADAFALVAVTMEDLYPDPEWNFVFGQASLHNRVGVFSFARYDPAFPAEDSDDEDEGKKGAGRDRKERAKERAKVREEAGTAGSRREEGALPREHDREREHRMYLLLRRSMGVATHEMGHMLGLRHCIHHRCLLNGCNHLDEDDARPLHLCPVCLRKLLASVPMLDPGARYRALYDFYKRLGESGVGGEGGEGGEGEGGEGEGDGVGGEAERVREGGEGKHGAAAAAAVVAFVEAGKEKERGKKKKRKDRRGKGRGGRGEEKKEEEEEGEGMSTFLREAVWVQERLAEGEGR